MTYSPGIPDGPDDAIATVVGIAAARARGDVAGEQLLAADLDPARGLDVTLELLAQVLHALGALTGDADTAEGILRRIALTLAGREGQ